MSIFLGICPKIEFFCNFRSLKKKKIRFEKGESENLIRRNLMMFGKKKPSWRTDKVEEFLDDFSIWAKHTGNQDWVGFAENKIIQLAYCLRLFLCTI